MTKVLSLTAKEAIPSEVEAWYDRSVSGNGQEQTFSPIPEPKIYAMLGAGLGRLGGIGRGRKKPTA